MLRLADICFIMQKTHKNKTQTMFIHHKKITVKNSSDGHITDTVAKIIKKSAGGQPCVSVIVPVHNSGKFLNRCLDTICNQSLTNIEIICVDDGSTDNSLKILKQYAKKDGRFTILHQKNLFAGIARNAGLAIAQGEYVAFLDSDDWFEQEMLATMYNGAKEHNADVVICDAYYAQTQNAPSGVLHGHNRLRNQTLFSLGQQEFAQDFFQTVECFPWNKIFKRSFVDTHKFFFPATYKHNDGAFVSACLVAAQKILYIPRKFVHYKVQEDSVTNNTKHFESICTSIIEGYYNIKNLPNFDAVRLSFYEKTAWSFWTYFLKPFSAQSKKLLRQQIRETSKLIGISKISKWAVSAPYLMQHCNAICTNIPIVIEFDGNNLDQLDNFIRTLVKYTYALMDIYVISTTKETEKLANTIGRIKDSVDCEITLAIRPDMDNVFCELPKIIPQQYETCLYFNPKLTIFEMVYELYLENISDNNALVLFRKNNKHPDIALVNLVKLRRDSNQIFDMHNFQKLSNIYNVLLKDRTPYMHEYFWFRTKFIILDFKGINYTVIYDIKKHSTDYIL